MQSQQSKVYTIPYTTKAKKPLRKGGVPLNSKMLLDALGDISDEYVMGAQKYLTNDVLKISCSRN